MCGRQRPRLPPLLFTVFYCGGSSSTRHSSAALLPSAARGLYRGRFVAGLLRGVDVTPQPPAWIYENALGDTAVGDVRLGTRTCD
jgi:hypothetical protein